MLVKLLPQLLAPVWVGWGAWITARNDSTALSNDADDPKETVLVGTSDGAGTQNRRVPLPEPQPGWSLAVHTHPA
jgi:hypothetical protein